MVNTFTFGTSLAPGVNLTQTILDTTPAPLANHAIAYLFVTVPGPGWEASPDNYSQLTPLVPTPVASLADYLDLIGGVVPNPAIDYEAFVSYKSVESFFANSGGSGVLYVVRTVITPQCKLELDSPTVDNHNYFTIKVDGVYYGDTDAGFNDLAGDPVKLITTTGIDLEDNTFDIVDFLKSNADFTLAYEVIDTPGQFTAGLVYFASRESGSIVDVQNFLSSAALPSVFGDLTSAGTVTKIANKRELNFKLELESSPTTGNRIYAVDPDLFDTGYYTRLDGAADANPNDFTNFDTVAGTALTADQFSAILNLYLVQNDPDVTSGGTDTVFVATNGAGDNFPIPVFNDTLAVADHYVAIPVNNAPYPVVTESGVGVATRQLDGVGENRLIYYVASLSGSDVRWAPVADISTVDFTVKSVQQFSVLAGSPSNRVVITTNGATVDAHEDSLLIKLGDALNDSTVILEESPNVDRGHDVNLVTVPALAVGVPFIISGDLSKGIYSWDMIASLEATSTINVPPYVWSATSPNGNVEHKLLNLISPDSEAIQTADSLTGPRLSDYVFTIRNSVNDVNLFPGFLLCPEAYAKFDSVLSGDSATVERDRRIAISSALNEVARNLNWFALVDDDANSLTSLDSTNEFNALTNSVGSGDGHFAFYYPWLITIENRKLPASPFVAGVALNRYTTESFAEPPAGVNYPLQGVLRPQYKLVRSQLEVNSPRGMNAIVTVPNAGVVVFGARTTATNTPVQFVNSRVVVNIVFQALKNSFDSFIFNAIRTDNVSVFNGVRTTATTILQDLFLRGALLGATPEDAYLIVCDNTNNTPANLAQGIVFCDIILAPASTLERLEIRTTVTSAGQVQSTLNV